MQEAIILPLICMMQSFLKRPIIEKRSAHICSISPQCIKRVAVKTCEHVFILFLICMAWLLSALHLLKVLFFNLKSIQEFYIHLSCR